MCNETQSPGLRPVKHFQCRIIALPLRRRSLGHDKLWHEADQGIKCRMLRTDNKLSRGLVAVVTVLHVLKTTLFPRQLSRVNRRCSVQEQSPVNAQQNFLNEHGSSERYLIYREDAGSSFKTRSRL